MLARPLEGDALIRSSKKSQTITVSEIRSRLAGDRHTDSTFQKSLTRL
jgi:hypothetical protein